MTKETKFCPECKGEIPEWARKCMHCWTNIAVEKQKQGCMIGCLIVMGIGLIAAIIGAANNSWGDFSYSSSSATSSYVNTTSTIPINTSVETIEQAIKNNENKGKVEAIEGIVWAIGKFEVSTWDWDNFASNKSKKIEVIVNADANSCTEAKEVVYAIMRGLYSSKHKKSLSRVKVNIPYHIKASLWSKHASLKRADLWAEDLSAKLKSYWEKELEKWSLEKITFMVTIGACSS